VDGLPHALEHLALMIALYLLNLSRDRWLGVGVLTAETAIAREAGVDLYREIEDILGVRV
jgi:hypothetical protein